MKIFNNKYLLIVVVVTVIAFFPTFENGFTNWDDQHQVTKNLDIKALSSESIKTFFSSFYAGMYQPITTLVYSVEYKLFGLNPLAYHATSLFFHLINIFLVFWFIKIVTKRNDMALIVCLLFSIHPLNVEAVAWVSARSTLMYSTFYIGALISYLYFLKSRKHVYLIATFLLFIISALTKVMAITLPLLLLLLDYFYSRKIFSKRIILEKIPFFIIAVVLVFVATKGRLIAGHIGYVGEYTMLDRLFLIPYQILWYIVKLAVPINLSAFYPNPVMKNGILPVIYYFSPIVLLFLGIALFKLKTHRKFVFFSFAFFLVNISLILHFFQLGNQITTDRYAYISSLGIYLFLSYFYVKIKNNKHHYIKYVNGFLLAVVLVFSFLSFQRTKVWNSSLILWEDVISKNDKVWHAYNSLGNIKLKDKDYKNALKYYNRTIHLNSRYYIGYFNRGLVRYLKGDYKNSYSDFKKSIEINPIHINDKSYQSLEQIFISSRSKFFKTGNISKKSYSIMHKKVGVDLLEVNLYEEALKHFDKAIGFDKTNAEAYFEKALLLGQKLGDFEEALKYLNTAIKMDSNNTYYFVNRGILYSILKKYDESIFDFDRAIEINKSNCAAYINRATMYSLKKDFYKAKKDIKIAQKLGCYVNPRLLKIMEN